MAHQGRLAGCRILLVEDDADIRAAFTILLETEGADVIAVASGRAALKAGRREPIDVLLTDLGLPDVPGDAVIRSLLARNGRRPHVVAITGYDEPHVSRARAAGASAVLTKPVDWLALLAHLERALTPTLAA